MRDRELLAEAGTFVTLLAHGVEWEIAPSIIRRAQELETRILAALASRAPEVARPPDLTEAFSEVLKELVEAVTPLLDNAEGYDKSVTRAAFLFSSSYAGLLKPREKELLGYEEHARFVWKKARAALGVSGLGEPTP